MGVMALVAVAAASLLASRIQMSSFVGPTRLPRLFFTSRFWCELASSPSLEE